MIEAPVPYRISAARGRKCLMVSLGDDNEPSDAHLRHLGVANGFAPDLPITLGEAARLLSRIETHDVKLPARRAVGAGHRMNTIPDRRVGPLQRLYFQDIVL